jgi:hypothetical protein
VQPQGTAHPQAQRNTAHLLKGLPRLEVVERRGPLGIAGHDPPDASPGRPVEVTLRVSAPQPGGDVGQHSARVAVGEQGGVKGRSAELRHQPGQPQVAGLAEPAEGQAGEPVVVHPALLTVAANNG